MGHASMRFQRDDLQRFHCYHTAPNKVLSNAPNKPPDHVFMNLSDSTVCCHASLGGVQQLAGLTALQHLEVCAPVRAICESAR